MKQKTPGLTLEPFDQDTFQRVWRRVMPDQDPESHPAHRPRLLPRLSRHAGDPHTPSLALSPPDLSTCLPVPGF